MTSSASLATVLNAGGPAVWVAVAASVLAAVPAGLRWLRVAQREHYLPGSLVRFVRRWWFGRSANVALGAIGVAGVVASAWWPLAALAAVVVVAVGPLGLSVRGRTSPLRWTRRLRSLAVVCLLLEALVVMAGILLGLPVVVAAAAAMATPLLVDLACALMAPIERRLVRPYVESAARRLQQVQPTVVAITGSYGKTTTKRHVADLVAETRTVVPTPASFNNRAGLARAINEHLADGTQVFVAEMGIYGPGEIAEMCSWCPPDISVITAIGPVHLERMRSEDRIVEAKAEIVAPAAVVVLNVDNQWLAELADRLTSEHSGKLILRCSGEDPAADVAVLRCEGDLALWVSGAQVGRAPAPDGIQPSNVACAAAVALQLGVPATDVANRMARLGPAPNRMTAASAPSGVVVIDDTFNSNPAGTRAALALLSSSGSGRRVVVTPGMVELGPRQMAENRAFASATAQVASHLVVVGRTNRRALLAGADGLPTVLVSDRESAVAWVRRELGPGDAVLYENDLPDHYP